jgi:spoIIIJ-associated protein
MERAIECTGKTIEEAINAALKQLNLDRDSISVEVLEKPKAGFLGLGGSPARIRATYESDEPDPVPAPVSAVNPAPAPKPAPAVGRDAPAAGPAKKPAAAASETPPPGGTRAAKAHAFLTGLLRHLEIEAQINAETDPDGNLKIELAGPRMGVLIGRRGDMLDAVQHLTGYVANKDEEGLVRVTVDTEGYRKKREDALTHLAEKTAAKVIKYRRNLSLEPMNSYARHVIHTALQEMPEVTTFSTGTDPNRRVVVALARPDGKPVSMHTGADPSRRFDNAPRSGGYTRRPPPQR